MSVSQQRQSAALIGHVCKKPPVAACLVLIAMQGVWLRAFLIHCHSSQYRSPRRGRKGPASKVQHLNHGDDEDEGPALREVLRRAFLKSPSAAHVADNARVPTQVSSPDAWKPRGLKYQSPTHRYKACSFRFRRLWGVVHMPGQGQLCCVISVWAPTREATSP